MVKCVVNAYRLCSLPAGDRITPVIAKVIQLNKMPPCLGKIVEDSPQGERSFKGLSADLLEAARRRNLSANSLAAYEANLDTISCLGGCLEFRSPEP